MNVRTMCKTCYEKNLRTIRLMLGNSVHCLALNCETGGRCDYTMEKSLDELFSKIKTLHDSLKDIGLV